jgi:hypothetical protein
MAARRDRLPPPTPPTRPRRGRAVAATIGSIVAIFATVELLEAMAVRVVAGNSDGATVVLEGGSIEHGHLLLGGWMLSLDSFWTIDAAFNAVAVAIAGIEPELLRAVPVAIATGVVVAGVVAAARARSGRSRSVAVALVAAVLVLPLRPLALFFVQGPYHVGTALYCVVAFAALSYRRFDWRWFAGVFILTAGVLGDFQMLPLGVLPVVGSGLLDGHRERSVRAAAPLVGGGIAAVGLTLVLRAIARAEGGFRPTKANTLASGGQMVRNLVHLPNEALSLLGLTTGPFGPSGVPIALTALHVVVVATILVTLVAAGRRMLNDVGHRPRSPVTTARRFEDTLALAVVGDLATFVLLPITSSDAYARYLTAGVIFSVILAARVVGGWSARVANRALPLALVGTIAVVAVASFAFALGGSAPGQPASALASYLEVNHLDVGVGDYWSSSIVTVDSSGSVAVRPVIAADGRLVRYDKQSEASWYSGARFEFYVYDTALIWNGDDRSVGLATFGRPERTVAVGTYRVLIFPRPIELTGAGSQGP